MLQQLEFGFQIGLQWGSNVITLCYLNRRKFTFRKRLKISMVGRNSISITCDIPLPSDVLTNWNILIISKN